MRGTFDKAGRLVIPKPLRDQVGLTPGEVDDFFAVVRSHPTSRDGSRTRSMFSMSSTQMSCMMSRSVALPSR
jgi:hypothetical protein